MRFIKGTAFLTIMLLALSTACFASNYKKPKAVTQESMLMIADSNGSIGRFYCIADSAFFVNASGKLQQLYIKKRSAMRCDEVEKVNMKYLLQLLEDK